MPSKKQRSLKSHKQSTLRRSVRRKTPRSNHNKNRRKSKTNHKRQHALVRGGTTSQNILTASKVVAGTTLTAMMIIAYRDYKYKIRTINHLIKLKKTEIRNILRFYCSYFFENENDTNNYDRLISNFLEKTNFFNDTLNVINKVDRVNTIKSIYDELFDVTRVDERLNMPVCMLLRSLLFIDTTNIWTNRTNSLEYFVVFFIRTCFFVVFDFVTFCNKKTSFKAEDIMTQWKKTSFYDPSIKSDYKTLIEKFLENREEFKTKFKNDDMTSIISRFCTGTFFQVQKRCVVRGVTGYEGSTCSHDDDDDGGPEVDKLSETLRSVPDVPVDVPVRVPVLSSRASLPCIDKKNFAYMLPPKENTVRLYTHGHH